MIYAPENNFKINFDQCIWKIGEKAIAKNQIAFEEVLPQGDSSMISSE